MAFGGVSVLVAVTAWFNRTNLTESIHVEPVTSQAHNDKAARRASNNVHQDAPSQQAKTSANLAPDAVATPAEKIRTLYASGDAIDAQLRAARSGDAFLLAHAPLMTLYCFEQAVFRHGKSAREWMTQISVDFKTGKPIPPHERRIAINEAYPGVGPLRVQLPPEFVATSIRLLRATKPSAQPDYAHELELAKLRSLQAVPLTDAQRASHTAAVERAVAECNGRAMSTEYQTAYRAGIDRLVANAVVSARLFNRRAGWTSYGATRFNENDYELVQRAMAEFQPDGIAKLLGGSSAVVGRIDTSWLTEGSVESIMMLEGNLGSMVACALGVSDCGPDSSRFRSACINFGGCDQPDLAALLRHVFERDGLDPAVIDREINRVVDAYQRRDLDALGVRRKK